MDDRSAPMRHPARASLYSGQRSAGLRDLNGLISCFLSRGNSNYGISPRTDKTGQHPCPSPPRPLGHLACLVPFRSALQRYAVGPESDMGSSPANHVIAGLPLVLERQHLIRTPRVHPHRARAPSSNRARQGSKSKTSPTRRTPRRSA